MCTLTLVSIDNFHPPYLDRRPQTPPSKAVKAARRKLSPKSETPRFNPDIHKAPESTAKQAPVEDSFIAMIESRSPAKIANAETIAEEEEPVQAMPEVVEDTMSPSGVTEVSPGKSSRIEDSVEAIDALEEAIEKAGASFAAVQDDKKSPVKQKGATTKKPASNKTTVTKATAKPKANTSRPIATPKAATQKPPVTKAPISKPAANRSAAVKKASQPTEGKPAAAKKPSQPTPAKSAKAAPAKTATPSTKPAPKPFKARPSTASNPPFIPARSTKAPTRSTFTLPGEAVSAKLKAQREERLKREEEEGKAKREFKARPVPSSRVSSGTSATLPRQNAASKARASLAKGEKIEIPKRQSINQAAASQRVSSTGAVVGVKTNTAKISPTAKGPSASARPSLSATLPSRPAKPSPNKAAPPAAKIGVTRSRTSSSWKAQNEEQNKAAKDKMEAAKKARAEAAERGRLASREWAERRKREVEARKVSGGAKIVVTASSTENVSGGNQEQEAVV